MSDVSTVEASYLVRVLTVVLASVLASVLVVCHVFVSVYGSLYEYRKRTVGRVQDILS